MEGVGRRRRLEGALLKLFLAPWVGVVIYLLMGAVPCR